MRRPLAYGKDLLARRQAGDRVGLLVVSVHDWEAGTWFAGRPEVARVVLPDDVPVADADWSPCMALDCVVTGGAVDGIFYAVCAALRTCGAASVWGEFDDGLHLLEPVGKRFVSVEGPVALPAFGAALRRHRAEAMWLRLGFYGSRIFDQARMAMIDHVPGLADLLKTNARGAA